jgi:hypothetical protein
MSADIVTAKKKLYTRLKGYSEVTGAGIREKDGAEFIVIFVSKKNSKVLGLIPGEYKGNTVKTEVRAVAKAM